MGDDEGHKSVSPADTKTNANNGDKEIKTPQSVQESELKLNDMPRETIINTAVKFLGNPRVQWTTLEQKQSFLRQKGLTETEIQEACRRANLIASTSDHEQQQVSLPPVPFRYPTTICQSKPELPLWFKIKEIGNVIALFSIGSYGLYTLWKSHIAPRFFGKPSRSEERNRVLLTAITALTTSVGELRALISKLECRLQAQTTKYSVSEHKEVVTLEEVRDELSSIKALLLSRTQFPSSPGIPSWQLVEKEGNSRDDSRDQSPHPNEEQSVGCRKEGTEEGIECNRGRKQSSSGSHESIALHSDGSSCEVVMIGGKQDSDHSDEA